MKVRTEKVIDVSEWDKLVSTTYGRPYSFQQQDGCREKGHFLFSVPSQADESEMNDMVPEVVNHNTMGVKFSSWLARDPKTLLPSPDDKEWSLGLWWGRNFYPDIQMVANDLHQRGLLDAGEYLMVIDW